MEMLINLMNLYIISLFYKNMRIYIPVYDNVIPRKSSIKFRDTAPSRSISGG